MGSQPWNCIFLIFLWTTWQAHRQVDSISHYVYIRTYIYHASLQNARWREKSTLMVLTRVFLALAPVRNPPKSAPLIVTAGVGVLLAQCLMKRLMLVLTWLTALKVSLWLLHDFSAVAGTLTNWCHAHNYTQTPVHKSAHTASVRDMAPMLSAQCKCVCLCDETLCGVHPHMHNAHVHGRAFSSLALASHNWCGQETGSSRNVNVLPIHHAGMQAPAYREYHRGSFHCLYYIWTIFCCVW